MKELELQLNSYIEEQVLIKPQNKILVAISGGVDSVVLANLLKRSSFYIELAHVNFQLRGEESERDERFVRDYAETLGLPLHLTRIDTKRFASEHKLSIQEAARKIRYDWFEVLIKEKQLDLIATAHHADDNVETMLMNLFRGTGLAGLRGILPKNGKIIRPLLFASRQQIENYSKEEGLSYVEDSSNASDKYTRNFLRLHIIPELTKIWPDVADNLRDNMIRFREAEMQFKESVNRRLKKIVIEKGDELHVPVEGLRFTQPLKTVVFEIYHNKGFSPKQIDEIIKLMDASTGGYIDSATHRIIKNRNWFICTPLHKERADLHIIGEQTSEVNTSAGLLSFKKENVVKDLNIELSIAYLDLNKIEFPLIVRPWKAGDYFYPLGMAKKKKIARFLIDKKISKNDKEKILVIESAGRICWIIGHRIDDRFKITPSTQNILTISFKKVS